MAPTVSTKANHARYQRALDAAPGKPQPKGGLSQRELRARHKARWAAMRHQTHTSKEHLTQTVLDAVAMCLDLKKAQFARKRPAKKLLRIIMARNAKDPAFSQFYQICENYPNWEEVIHLLASRPQDVELNASLAFVARQIINSAFPQVQPEPLTRTPAQSPLQFEEPKHILYECGECEHPFRHDGPIDENHCPACGCITHDAQVVDEPEELTEVQTYLDGSVKYVKIVGFASGFDYEDENLEACQQTLDQIDQLIHASPDKIYFIWDNDQDGDGALQYVLRQLASTYSNDYIGFIRIKRDIDPDNLIREMEHFEVINVVNTTDELSDAPPGDWSFHGKVGIDKMVLRAAHNYPEQHKLAIFFVGGAATAFATSQDGQPEGEAPYYERTYPDVPLFINEHVSRNGQTSANLGWPATRGSVFQ